MYKTVRLSLKTNHVAYDPIVSRQTVIDPIIDAIKYLQQLSRCCYRRCRLF